MEATSDSSIFFEVNESLDYTLEQAKEVGTWLGEVANNHKKDISNLEYIFCSDEQLLGVNRKYLDHDFYTDIITFPLSEDPLEASIYISIDRVKENSEHYKTTFTDELHRVMVHGLLHLLGYNDKTDEQNKIMRKAEDRCLGLRSFNISG